MKNGVHPGCRRTRQSGFSMIEFLVTAFILAIGLLGLTMLQAMALRASTGSRNLNAAVMVGEGVLESIQMEGRQRMLFLKYNGSAPATTYFGAGDITQYYDIDGKKLDDATGAFFEVGIKSSDLIAKTATVGGTKKFTLTVQFTDMVKTTAVKRTVTLTRQVAYA